MSRLPDFIIIGAMKSATSTLYEQLLQQPGIFMPALKEPNFFSNDEQFSRGLEWYSSLFDGAATTDIIGEASTHYTKLPTYPKTIERMVEVIPSPRLIYVLRHPVERLISQYIHQWSEGEIDCGIDEALMRNSELVSYSCYAQQLAPFIETYGRQAILPVFFSDIKHRPQETLEQICQFIGYHGEVEWKFELAKSNVSAQRMRTFPFQNLVVENPVATWLRQRLVPKAFRTRVRNLFTMQEKPVLSERSLAHLEQLFDNDLEILGGWVGCEITCANFNSLGSKDFTNWHKNS
jgi:Sulfotransferase domain